MTRMRRTTTKTSLYLLIKSRKNKRRQFSLCFTISNLKFLLGCVLIPKLEVKVGQVHINCQAVLYISTDRFQLFDKLSFKISLDTPWPKLVSSSDFLENNCPRKTENHNKQIHHLHSFITTNRYFYTEFLSHEELGNQPKIYDFDLISF